MILSVNWDAMRLMSHHGKDLWRCHVASLRRYNDVIINAMASQITSLTIVFSTVYSVTDQRKHQSSASVAFVRGIHRWPLNSPHKGPVTRKMFPWYRLHRKMPYGSAKSCRKLVMTKETDGLVCEWIRYFRVVTCYLKSCSSYVRKTHIWPIRTQY